MVALIPVQILQRPIVLVEAPTNLGLRPPCPGVEPGAWEAPQALRAAGLGSAIGSSARRALPRPVYHADPPPFSTIRNAYAIYHFTLALSAEIGEVFAGGDFPLVIGGDCSVLLGGLLAARRHGRFGLVHLDGHSDFFHPGNYDVTSRPGTVAGMDLALAVGLGESLLTRWDDDAQPLIDPHDVIQIGERESRDPDFAFADLISTGITQIDIFEVNEIGILETWRRAEALFDRRGLDAFWLHLDLDVLDQRVMPAVDFPGSPGLDFPQLAQLLGLMRESERCIGADITIFDPSLDPTGGYAQAIVKCLGNGFSSSLA